MAGHVPKGSRDEHRLERVIEASIRGRELVQQMLSFASRGEHEKKPVRLSDVIRGTMNLLRASIPSTIGMKLDLKSESAVLGDVDQIR